MNKFITSNPVMATILFKADFEIQDERKVINGVKTWTFVVPPEKQYEFIRIRKSITGHIPRL